MSLYNLSEYSHGDVARFSFPHNGMDGTGSYRKATTGEERYSQTPLSYAVRNRQEAVVLVLLEKGPGPAAKR